MKLATLVAEIRRQYRHREPAAFVLVALQVIYRRTHFVATFYKHREDEALAIDDIVTGMRRVIDQLPAAERKLILTSIRSKWSDIADRLEAPSSRNH
jgi:hypothetical protein